MITYNLSIEKNYKNLLVEDLILKGNYKNKMELPKIEKIVLNSSSKNVIYEKKSLLPTILSIQCLSGQIGQRTKAKRSIATFNLRENQVLGEKLTLRGIKKEAFFYKLVKIILPRLPEFFGNSLNCFDKQGNLNLGIEEMILFSENDNLIAFFEYNIGVNINIKINAAKKQEALLLFSLYQLPIETE